MTKKPLIKIVTDTTNGIQIGLNLLRLDNSPYDWTYSPEEYTLVSKFHISDDGKHVFPNNEKDFYGIKEYPPYNEEFGPLQRGIAKEITKELEEKQICLLKENKGLGETELYLPRKKEVRKRLIDYADKIYTDLVCAGYLKTCKFNPNNMFYTPERVREKIIEETKKAPNVARIKKKGYKNTYEIPPLGLYHEIEREGFIIPRCDEPVFNVRQFRDYKWE